MIKTQVQIPDHLYREAKRVATDYEMSFAEVVRRGLERITQEYASKPQRTDWAPPLPPSVNICALCLPLRSKLSTTSIADEPRRGIRQANASRFGA